MAEGLQRSESTFKRQGSSSLIWDDKFLQRALNQVEAEKQAEAAHQAEGGNGGATGPTMVDEVPKTQVFLNQETRSFTSNPDLCGPPTKNPCPIPSSPSSSPNALSPNSPPAFAAIPRNPEASSPRSKNGHSQQSQTGLRPAVIVGIVAGDIAGIGIFALFFMYIYILKNKNSTKDMLSSLHAKPPRAMFMALDGIGTAMENSRSLSCRLMKLLRITASSRLGSLELGILTQ
ncbi:hypothetical protein EV1_030676 [Malus domestica]